MPAFRASRRDPSVHLADRTIRRVLMATELAVTVVLLAATALFLASLRKLQTDPLGFDTAHILTAGVCCW